MTSALHLTLTSGSTLAEPTRSRPTPKEVSVQQIHVLFNYAYRFCLITDDGIAPFTMYQPQQELPAPGV